MILTRSFKPITVNDRGEEIKRETKQAQYFTEDLGNGVTLEMVAIPGGQFLMGSPEGEGNESEKPQHEVTVPSLLFAHSRWLASPLVINLGAPGAMLLWKCQ